ncbi:MAG: hypothetical protein KDA47_15710 [Planctomycetales bacterium]|nr:hypothetical protein [Planctomycetales bacterium]
MKKKSQVFHDVDPVYSSPRLHPVKLVRVFRLVAEVETDDLKAVFGLTNHADVDWTENDGVHAIGNVFRSTSVGDIIVTSDGYAYVVTSGGFRSIGKSS